MGHCLKVDGYDFRTPTPLTHGRVLARGRPGADILRDAFGWNRPVLPNSLSPAYREFLTDPALFLRTGGEYRAKVRFSTLGPLLLGHSGYPTEEADAVFFGPDTYRFTRAIHAFREREPDFAPQTCADIGAGTGAGGLFCASLFPSLNTIALLDINPRALAFATANIALNGISIAEAHFSDILSGWDGPVDLIVSNPPYLIDPSGRAYRHGGGDWGTLLAARILEQSLTRLHPNGHLLLYTGSAIVDGRDTFLETARPILDRYAIRCRYEEIDPDVFGEELDRPPYDRAERIATVLLHVKGPDLMR